MEFYEYALMYIKHKDLMKRTIISIEPRQERDDETQKRYVINTKVGETRVLYVVPKMQDYQKQTELAQLVTRNEEQNVKYILKNWAEFVKLNCLIIFLDHKNHSKWSINPALHDKVTEKKDLERGVMSLFQSSISE